VRVRRGRRFEGAGLWAKAAIGLAEFRVYGQHDKAGPALIRQAMQLVQMIAWEFHRVLKLSRTIPNLEGSEGIESPPFGEGAAQAIKGVVGRVSRRLPEVRPAVP